MRSQLLSQVMRFGAVGVVGFIIDGGLLWLFISLGLNPYLARALSFPIAVIVTWALNRSWTFGATADAHPKRQFQRYFGVQVVGTLTNYVVYSLIVSTYGTQGTTVFIGFALGSFLGAFVNFFGARTIAFRV